MPPLEVVLAAAEAPHSGAALECIEGAEVAMA